MNTKRHECTSPLPSPQSGEGGRRVNSRDKGARGERQWRDELRANGYSARRGQQFSGSAESPDVVCEELDWIHFEVKAVERLNIEAAMEQARRDQTRSGRNAAVAAPAKVPVVAHKRNHRQWLVTMEAEFFFELLREFEPRKGAKGTEGADATASGNTPSGLRPPSPQCGEGGAHGMSRPTENNFPA